MTNLRLWGVSRADDNEQALLLHFDRRPTTEEMVKIHERLKSLRLADDEGNAPSPRQNDSVYPSSGLVAEIEDAMRTVTGWPPQVRRAIGIPDEPEKPA